MNTIVTVVPLFVQRYQPRAAIIRLLLFIPVLVLCCSLMQGFAQTLNVITRTGTIQIKTGDIDSATIQSTTFTVIKKDKSLQVFTLTDIQRLIFTNLTAIQQNSYPSQLHSYPNPSNAAVIIEYELLQPSPVELRIFDMAGNLLKTIRLTIQQPGKHELVWNATNQHDVPVSSGFYTCIISTTHGTLTKKLTIAH